MNHNEDVAAFRRNIRRVAHVETLDVGAALAGVGV